MEATNKIYSLSPNDIVFGKRSKKCSIGTKHLWNLVKEKVQDHGIVDKSQRRILARAILDQVQQELPSNARLLRFVSGTGYEPEFYRSMTKDEAHQSLVGMYYNFCKYHHKKMVAAADATNQTISKIQESVGKSKNIQPPSTLHATTSGVATEASPVSSGTPTTAESFHQQDHMMVLSEDSQSNGVAILGMEHQRQAFIDTIFGTTLHQNYHHHDRFWSKRKLPTTVSPSEPATPDLEAPLLDGGAGIKEE